MKEMKNTLWPLLAVIIGLILALLPVGAAVFTRVPPKTYPDLAKWKYYVMYPEIIAAENDPNSTVRTIALEERAKMRPYIENADCDIADSNDHRYADGVIDDHDVNMIIRAKGTDGRCIAKTNNVLDVNDPNIIWVQPVYK